MAELKTKANNTSVGKFLDSLDDSQQAADSRRIIDIMGGISGEKPVMWGAAIIGFGSMRLKYESGRELDWMRIGFSPRKGKITLYITMEADKLASGFNLGKYKTGKGCIYISSLSDVNEDELAKMIQTAYGQTL